jgi:glyoxylase-like metal-dependent hydrolase (beta-lactamase superfamily II)
LSMWPATSPASIDTCRGVGVASGRADGDSEVIAYRRGPYCVYADDGANHAKARPPGAVSMSVTRVAAALPVAAGGGGMLLRPFLNDATSCASYLFGARATDAGRRRSACGSGRPLPGLRRRSRTPDVAVFETHVQADHVSGLPELVGAHRATASPGRAASSSRTTAG